LLDFLYYAVSWVLLRWHQLFTAIGIGENSGVNWTLSIVCLVLTARLLLFRFFVKQVHYQRHMQEMQPKMAKIKEKYKNDKQAQQREIMALQKEEGFNPVAGCLPMLLQIPVFIGLLHVLRHLAAAAAPAYQAAHPAKMHLYGFTTAETKSAAVAKIFNAPLAGALRSSDSKIHLLGGDVGTMRVVIVVLIVVSAAATLFTQMLVRANATTVPEGTAATIQNAMLFFIPLSVLGSGLFFPLGVLLYWFTSNLWTLGQQAYIIRFHPHVPKETAAAAAPSKALAPKPGAKPDRNRAAGVQLSKGGDVDDDVAVLDTSSSAALPAPAPGRPPRPGARPQTRAGNRPASKRPTQSKKRR
jgi:YidC/Oxa1 family membrane protein insertase